MPLEASFPGEVVAREEEAVAEAEAQQGMEEKIPDVVAENQAGSAGGLKQAENEPAGWQRFADTEVVPVESGTWIHPREEQDTRISVEQEESKTAPPCGMGSTQREDRGDPPQVSGGSLNSASLEQQQVLGYMELHGTRGTNRNPENPSEDEPEMSDIGYALALLIGILGLYTLRLFVAALAGQNQGHKVLPKLAVKIQSIDTTQVDFGGKQTSIEADRPSSTTTSTPALERANSIRPNKRGVRKKAGRTSMFEDGTAEEEESLGHLTWLMGSDANALRDLQNVLAGLKTHEMEPSELVQKLQAFDAQRLLHSEVVCKKALVHAGLSLDAAEAASRQLYSNQPQQRDTSGSSPSTPLSSTTGSRAASPGRQSPGQQSPVISCGPRRTSSACSPI
ncbi:uncharacterized protein LOC142358332 [Convolutriloba macropyga]|uniref:uncharacterized protein LOC142358332 n=1 Tax=Convolutriloba macropyga TaxID=536237 RepID=UPI003F527416